MTTYEKCPKCKKWVDHADLDYLVDVGEICKVCSEKIRKEENEKEN